MILLVEDEPSIALAMKLLLESRGYSVHIANSCDEALAAIDENPPELILSDINMPDRSGYELLRILKETGYAENIPLVFVSAMSRPEDVQRGLAAGARDYVTKPFAPSRLLETTSKYAHPGCVAQKQRLITG